MIKGIDISSYQAGLNYRVAKDMGMNVCIIKATESNNYVNSSLSSQVASALAVGMDIGFYHFFRNSGTAEGKYFVDKIRPYISNMTVKPVIDIETTYSYSEVLDFINYVEKNLGVECMVYCSYYYAKDLSKNSEIAKRPLWLAYYGVNDGNYYVAPSDHGFKVFAGQQYSDKNYIGKVNVDMNMFNEKIYIKNSSNNNSESSNNTSKRVKNADGTYTVKAGDTLSEIARDFGMDYKVLASINGISNPSLIYVGQVIKFTASNTSNNTSSVRYYTVVKGDTLSTIAAKYGTTAIAIAKDNNIINVNLIYVGQVLKISLKSNNSKVYYTVVKGDTLSQIAAKYGISYESIVKLNGISNSNLIYPGQVLRIK